MNLKKIRVGDLFNVDTGSLVDKMYLHSGSCERISVTSSQNGVIGKYDDSIDIPNIRYYSNFISINFFGKAFYHPGKASVEMKVHVLTLKSGQPFTESLGLYLATQLNNLFGHGKYGYGSQLSSSMLKHDDFYLLIPVTDSGQLDVQYMEQYIKRIEAQYIKRIEAYLSVLGYDSIDDCELSSQDLKVLSGPDEWGKFVLSNLFDYIEQGSRLKKSDQLPGDLPYVMSGITNQGIANYISNNLNLMPAGSLTVDILGNVFYRSYQYGLSDDVGCYYDKQYSYKQMLYLATAISKAMSGKYSYGKKFRSSQSSWIKIKLPVTSTGKPDYDFMDHYITAIEKKKVLLLKQYLDQRLDLYQRVAD